MKSQIEHINIKLVFHLISEMFTIYLPFYIAKRLAMNLCNYQSEYKLTNCTHALQQSKDLTCTCIPFNKNNYCPYLETVISKILAQHFFKTR
jgi:hypothetical protein